MGIITFKIIVNIKYNMKLHILLHFVVNCELLSVVIENDFEVVFCPKHTFEITKITKNKQQIYRYLLVRIFQLSPKFNTNFQKRFLEKMLHTASRKLINIIFNVSYRRIGTFRCKSHTNQVGYWHQCSFHNYIQPEDEMIQNYTKNLDLLNRRNPKTYAFKY